MEYPAKSHLVFSFPGQVSIDQFCLRCTISYYSTVRSLIMALV